MYTTWIEASKAGRSPLNVGRSTERNRRKQARTDENRAYRADLHRSKVNSRSDANTIQIQIDQIKERK